MIIILIKINPHRSISRTIIDDHSVVLGNCYDWWFMRQGTDQYELYPKNGNSSHHQYGWMWPIWKRLWVIARLKNGWLGVRRTRVERCFHLFWCSPRIQGIDQQRLYQETKNKIKLWGCFCRTNIDSTPFVGMATKLWGTKWLLKSSKLFGIKFQSWKHWNMTMTVKDSGKHKVWWPQAADTFEVMICWDHLDPGGRLRCWKQKGDQLIQSHHVARGS